MTHSLARILNTGWGLVTLTALLGASLATAGCASTTPPTMIYRRSNVSLAHGALGTYGTAMATCLAGEVLLGGGYRTSSPAVVVNVTKPEGMSWQVDAYNSSIGGPATLTAYADCLAPGTASSNGSMPTTVPLATAAHVVTSTPTLVAPGSSPTLTTPGCAASQVATGGGYQITPSLDESGKYVTDLLPVAATPPVTWRIHLISSPLNAPFTAQVFAICATHLSASSVAVHSNTPAPATGGSTAEGCTSGLPLLTGGGYGPHFTYGPLITMDAANADNDWEIATGLPPSPLTGPPPSPLLAWAVCSVVV
jgi:hypothetical protein